MKPRFSTIAIFDEQAKTLLDIYLNAKENDSRDLVAIYGEEILLELEELCLMTTEEHGREMHFFLTGNGLALARILDHQENGVPYDEAYLSLPFPGEGPN